MSSAPIRRAQLIAPFGVGAMLTAPDGTSMIAASLDGWFDPDATSSKIDMDEYRISEWRLEAALKVSELRLPPDHRTASFGKGEVPTNIRLKVPYLRFPLWHFCPFCRALHEVAPHHGSKRRCPSCELRSASAPGAKKKRWSPFLAQVPFVAMCEDGHLEDFPWREWVHQTSTPTCQKQMYLRATGGASLASQSVHCDCGIAPRTLSQITEAQADETGAPDTYLSSHLMRGGRYDCRGRRPWVDDRVGEGCGKPLRGSLRGATNVYYAHVESAIYLPGGTLGLPEGLLELLESPPLANTIHFARELGITVGAAVLRRDKNGHLLNPFPDDEEIDRALAGLEQNRMAAGEASTEADAIDPQAIRRPEFEMLRKAITAKDLKVSELDSRLFAGTAKDAFTKVNLVTELRETRVLYGFSRIRPDGQLPLSRLKRRLWQDEPNFQESWLPAYIVHGEGLFFEFDESRLRDWECQASVVERVQVLASSPERVRVHRGLADPTMVPRYVLLHTFAHILINQLVFDCGYSSASLRERLFCATGEHPMAGVLIYTAAGDSEGTMGGLVRMGRPENLEPTLAEALERARWCSSDPVCMELGVKGQGPGGVNLAACHSCALLPETACEVFNRFLDRGLVVGSHSDPSIGFFTA